MAGMISRLYTIMDRRPIRALSLIMALLLAGCMFWDPRRFAASSSSLEIWQGLLMMWAVCAGVIHGVGFSPRRLRWQTFFSPVPAWCVLLPGLIFFFN
ncbi:cyd operon protein YbgE [Erwinia oleae]|uniref:cyd operon protein YbgE n=1 Tax=Erwinia oleae TaxID=796334 RepID=UPI000B1C91CD|nr:cyd operon protein YbgE [Erwinia oleae]